MITYILDTSVVLKWFNQTGENDVNLARKIYSDFTSGNIRVIIPSLLFLELLNVLLKAKKINARQITKLVKNLFLLPFVIKAPTETVLEKACHLAEKYELTVYDGLFLALAQEENCQLISADIKDHGKISNGSVLLLSDYQTAI